MTEAELDNQFSRLMDGAMRAADGALHASVMTRLVDALVKFMAIKARGSSEEMNHLLEATSQAMFELGHDAQQMLAELDKEDGRSAP